MTGSAERTDAKFSFAARLVDLGPDAATEAFVSDCRARPHGPFRLAWRRLLNAALSDYDANGLAGTHDMHLVGSEGFWRLLRASGFEGRAGARLLDIGAGDGGITEALGANFSEVVTTELSGPMSRRLRRRGFRCHRVDLARSPLPEPGPFDVVALLNVLDRTERPRSLLDRARELVAEEGRLLVAVPLPLAPHVHVGPHTVDPDEPLPCTHRTWSEGVEELAHELFTPAGLEVRAIARLPYLCRGDRTTPVVALDDALFACAARAER